MRISKWIREMIRKDEIKHYVNDKVQASIVNKIRDNILKWLRNILRKEKSKAVREVKGMNAEGKRMIEKEGYITK